MSRIHIGDQVYVRLRKSIDASRPVLRATVLRGYGFSNDVQQVRIEDHPVWRGCVLHKSGFTVTAAEEAMQGS